MAVTVSMEDGPLFKLRLSEHLALDLAVYLSRVLFDIERDRRTAGARTHKEISSFVLKTFQLLRILIELEVPKLLLFNTFRI